MKGIVSSPIFFILIKEALKWIIIKKKHKLKWNLT